MRVRSPWSISHKWRNLVSSGRMSCCFSLVLYLFCFVFIFVRSHGPLFNRSLFFDMHALRQPHVVTYQVITVCALFFLFLFLIFFVYLKISFFPSGLVLLPFSLCMENSSYVFPSQMVFFYLVTMGFFFLHHMWDFNQINQSIGF